MSKVFYCFDHNIFNHENGNYDIRVDNIGILKFYPSDRQLIVVVNNKQPEIIDVRSGVPQDSILGPIIVSIMVNNVVGCCEKTMVYADNTIIFSVSNHIQNLTITRI